MNFHEIYWFNFKKKRFLRKVCASEEGSDADPNIWLESFKFFKYKNVRNTIEVSIKIL